MDEPLYTIHGQGKKFEVFFPKTNHINILVINKNEESQIAKDFEISYVKHCLAFSFLLDLRTRKQNEGDHSDEKI